MLGLQLFKISRDISGGANADCSTFWYCGASSLADKSKHSKFFFLLLLLLFCFRVFLDQKKESKDLEKV